MAKQQPAKSKVDSVIALSSRKSGTTLKAIAERLKISLSAASSLVQDARRKGVKIKCEQRADGDSRYYL
jgi:DNA-binding transcriptional regulator LsrR (DeoR family)